MGEENKQNGNEEQNNLKPPDPLHEAEKKGQESDNAKVQIEQKKNKVLLWWSKIETGDKTQIVLVFINIIMVGAFIYFGWKQIEKTNEALIYTSKSIELAEQSADSSNASTKEALRISDSSLTLSENSLAFTKQNIKMIRDNARTELRAYVQADSVYFNKFNVGKGGMIINLRLANVGKTPAYDLVILGRPKLGGTGIYDTDFGTLKDTAASLFIGGNGGYLTWTTIDSTFILSKEDSVRISEGKIFLGYFAKIFYTDKFGNRDSLRVCRIYDSILRSFVLCNNYYEIQKPN